MGMSKDQETRYRIKEAIEAFAGDNLSDNALHLLKALGYAAPRLGYFGQGTFAEFEGYFAQGNTAFNQAHALHDRWKKVDLLFQLTDDHLGFQQGLSFHDGVDAKNASSYLFFVLELKPKAPGASYTRTDLSRITREVNKCFLMPALILFKYPLADGTTALTLAVIDRRLHKRDAAKDVLEKVTLIKDIRTAGTNRAHIEILFDLSYPELRRVHGVGNFSELHAAWRKTLDTKELNKRFFRELSNWYFHAVETTEWPADAEPDREKRNAINVIRLITRIMFTWFLREKGLVPDALFDQRQLKRILRDDTGEESLYYKAILQNLFFATLNTEMGKRRFRAEADRSQSRHYFIHNVFRYERCFTNAKGALKELFAPIPFLNGGLFECLDRQEETKGGKLDPIRIDGFSDRKDNPLHVPDRLFFDAEGEEYDFSEVYGNKRARKEKVRGLIDILSSYKFTIAENTPIEEEVALDPELLGKVFENLLANFNPETKTTARKQTGSFYTPREIVNYMVDESLIAYLAGALRGEREEGEGGNGDKAGKSGDGNLEKKLRQVLAYSEEPHPFTPKETDQLIAAIDRCKILDPACGSGAFPMGMLQKLVHLLHKLDPENKKWRARQLERVDRMIAEAENLSDDSRINQKQVADLRETKADIERTFTTNALDYGRKLYLIENSIYGVDIQPIAMQIAKLRFFISLIVDQRIDPKLENQGVRPLPNLETKFVAANTLMKLKEERQNTLFANPAIDQKKAELKRVRHDYFVARTPERKTRCREKDKELRAELTALLEEEHDLQPQTAKMLAHWDPYDQNASAPFFDPEWMFGLNGGFDMVIGNPPYVRQESFTALKPDLQQRYPETYTSIADLFTYFIQAGHDLLAPNGVFCYIVSNKWMRAGYGAKLRAYLGKHKLLQLLDFGEQPVFEATTYTCVLLSQKAVPPKGHAVHTWAFTDLPLEDLPGFFAAHAHRQEQHAFVQADYRIGDAAAEALMAKLKSMGKPLGEYLKGGIYYGIKTGYNKAFVIDKATRDSLIKADKRSKEVIKPFLAGKDVRRYGTPVPDKWLILLPFGITRELIGQKAHDEAMAFHGMKKEYPAIMQHLKAHEEACIARSDQGQFWWELRACDYYEEFEKPKMLVPTFLAHPAFVLDVNRCYSNDKTTLIRFSEKWLMAMLNSGITGYFVSQISSSKQGGYFEYKPMYIEQIPVIIPSAKVKAKLERLVTERMALPPGPEAEAVEKEIDQVVYKLYGLTEAEIKIVEESVGRGKE